jgi:hypothetical protein
VAVADPVPLDAVTVYEVDGLVLVGVPEIVPVFALIARPAGKVGLMVKPVTVPVTVGVSGVMAVPTMTEIEVCG